jgi:hypothetical protein
VFWLRKPANSYLDRRAIGGPLEGVLFRPNGTQREQVSSSGSHLLFARVPDIYVMKIAVIPLRGGGLVVAKWGADYDL